MNRIWNGLSAAAGSLLLTTVVSAASRPAPRLPAAPAPQKAPAAPAASAQPTETSVDDPELKRLLDRLGVLSDLIGKNASGPDAWRPLLEQGDLLMQLAARSKGEERENWLRMGIDSYYSAAIQSGANDAAASNALSQLPARIAHEFAGSPLVSYAGMQIVEADYVRAVGADPEHPDKARERLHDHLMAFAREYPQAPETPKAVMEAAQISESLGKTEVARACYRYLADNFAGQPAGRKAGGSLARLGLGGEPVRLELPLLFAPESRNDSTFDLKDLRGKLVAVYFWSSASPQAAEDVQLLKDLAVKYQDRGLEVVYVNMDEDLNAARTFLAGRLTMGTHVYQRGGLDGLVAERYGIQTLPTLFLLGNDGSLIKQLPAAGLEAEVSSRLPRGR
jgi:thiol-disulfide isomerase/thioredoxin